MLPDAAIPEPRELRGQAVRVVLASRSPRRAELLAAAGLAFDVQVVDVDETPRPREAPRDYVERLAIEKAMAVARSRPDDVVLAADTTVVIDGRMLGKPAGAAEAAEMLRRLQGRDHDVLTGVAAAHGDAVRSRVESTRVWFVPMSAEAIDRYVAGGEPLDKAGAYAIQGLGSRFVSRIQGSYTNVVGLPVTAAVELLAEWLPEFRH
jgi:septum formation protein